MGTEMSHTQGMAAEEKRERNSELLAGLVIAYSAEIKKPTHIEKKIKALC
jgi:hypothetical protein